ncbi:Hypothetical protein R9X50_00752000 [Acrodontium crateriforme]|uniref:Elongin-C n=1 Tax=Acrodontium crateriforme TaxID=150365 RepID=A0AAQ3MBL6_9PEZI|nr:Hypothetical protein R9X50_00752000 [Acrodontium crateriforme]
MATEASDLSDYVTLVSSDEFSFVVQRTAACLSPAIKRMLDPTNGFLEAKMNTCRFDNITGVVLEQVCEYFYYNQKHQNSKDVPDMDFPTELCLEILIAADYLGRNMNVPIGNLYTQNERPRINFVTRPINDNAIAFSSVYDMLCF